MHPGELAAYDEVTAHTLSLGDPGFVHQHVVDAFGAQQRPLPTPMAVVFALIGLYLHVERGASGREVQATHARLAASRRDWPRMAAPADRGSMTILDVAAQPPGPERARAIEAWCQVVWESWHARRADVLAILRDADAG